MGLFTIFYCLNKLLCKEILFQWACDNRSIPILKKRCMIICSLHTSSLTSVYAQWNHHRQCILSQTHRMAGVGRDLCGQSSPTPLPKQGHQELVAQDLVQVGFECLQRRRIHNVSGQPVPVLPSPSEWRSSSSCSDGTSLSATWSSLQGWI